MFYSWIYTQMTVSKMDVCNCPTNVSATTDAVHNSDGAVPTTVLANKSVSLFQNLIIAFDRKSIVFQAG